MEAVFCCTETVSFNEFFILARGNGFSVNYKPFALIQSFFLLVDTILKIKCRPIFKV